MKIKDPLDRLKRLEEDMGALKGTVSDLRSQLGTLHEALKTSRHPVEAFLWQRGFPVISQCDRSGTLLPSDVSPKANEHFYQLMRRYSFRLFLRDLIQFPEGKDFNVLNRYCSMKTVRSYLEDLAQLGMVTLGQDGGYHLALQQLSSFGPTLEWYVSEIFQREFMAPALFNVRLQHTHYGGDYDVIALIGGRLVYVEVKSSPPRGVELQAVSAFLNRLQDLRPHVAVFLVDTELRMKDKIVPLFAQALGAPDEQTESSLVSRLIHEVFHIHHSIYLLNSRKGIYSNLRYCFRDSSQAVKKAFRATSA